jgi:hypothetical protein
MATVTATGMLLQPVERKVCEGFDCGAMFWREQPENAKCGEKLCPACRRRELNQARQELEQSRQTRVLRKAS